MNASNIGNTVVYDEAQFIPDSTVGFVMNRLATRVGRPSQRICECGKHFVDVTGPDGKTKLCLFCAARLARSIKRQAKAARRRQLSPRMAIPKTRRNR